jgi:hypothetical protein
VAAALAIALVATPGCSMLMKFAGNAAAAAMTQKTGNLSDLSVRVMYTTNLFPKASGMIEAEDSGELWQDGQNMLGVILMKRQGVGMYELDGAVGYQEKPNGPIIPIPYMGKGAYYIGLGAKDTAPKTIVIRAANGQTARLAAAPAKPITIKAINGKAPKNAAIDLGKDVVLDLANPAGTLGSPIKVSIASQAMGIRTMTAVGNFKAADRVVVPKEAFRNLQISASHDVGAVGVLKGDSYLVVERYTQALPASACGAAEVLGQAWGWTPVTVSGDAPLNSKLEASAELPGASSKIAYYVFKPAAFYAPPLPVAKTVAVGTLRARGKLYEKKVYESKSYLPNNYVRTTTTTIVKQFPEVPDSHWNALLIDLENRLGASLKRVANTQLVSADRLAGSATYKAMKEIVEKRDTRDGATAYVEKLRPGSRYVVSESLDTIQVSSTFAADQVLARVMREGKVDGLLSATLDLQIATNQDDKIVLIPRLSYVLYGPPNGYAVGPVTYAMGFVETAEGVPFNGEALQSDPGEMSRVARLSELVGAFEAALKAMRAKEQAAGYDAIWRGR